MIERAPKCEVCKINPAEMIIFRRKPNSIGRSFVCVTCAADLEKTAGGGVALSSIVQSVLSMRQERPQSSYACSMCGLTMAEAVADGKPGCCLCYYRFSDEIAKSVLHMQCHDHHVGKNPNV